MLFHFRGYVSITAPPRTKGERLFAEATFDPQSAPLPSIVHLAHEALFGTAVFAAGMLADCQISTNQPVTVKVFLCLGTFEHYFTFTATEWYGKSIDVLREHFYALQKDIFDWLSVTVLRLQWSWSLTAGTTK